MEEHLQLWWDLFAKHVQPKLDSTCSGLAGKLSQVDLSEKTGSAITGVAGLEKKQATSHYARADYPWITPPSQNKAEKSIGG
ncbi:hypothetical protein HDE_09669 [Halotydeus destructor]|nr:hypothetical protein HDE_09669 [Halotydeus destructor]